MEIQTIGEYIKKRRIALGLTQKDIADELNISGNSRMLA